MNNQYEQKRREFAEFADNAVARFAESCDQTEQIAPEVLDAVRKAGYFGHNVGPEYGGAGQDPIEYGLLHEEIGRVCSSLRSILTVHTMVTHAIAKWGTQQQRNTYLPRLAAGEFIGCLALTEANAGSDAASIESKSTRTPCAYSLRGTKKWVTAGAIAELFLVFVLHDGAPTAFLVDRSSMATPPRPVTGMMGIRGAMLADITLDGSEITEASILGKAGFGLSHVAASALDLGRYSIACGCTGISEACLRATYRHSSQRSQFGSSLLDFQLIQRLITGMVVNTEASRLMCRSAGYSRINNDPDSYAKTAQAKYFASRAATQSSLDAVQIHGAIGCSLNHPVSRLHRDSRIMEIIEGSTQILEVLIAQLAGDTEPGLR